MKRWGSKLKNTVKIKAVVFFNTEIVECILFGFISRIGIDAGRNQELQNYHILVD